MASSPTEEALQQVVGVYDRALEAVGRADLARVERLLDDADRALAGLQDPGQDADEERDLRRRAVEGQARLVAAMDGHRREVFFQLQKAHEGRKVLKTYGHRANRVGTRLRSEG